MSQKNIIIILSLSFCQLFGIEKKSFNDSLRFEVFMTKKMISDISLDAKFINAIEVTQKKHIIISTNNQLYVTGWGGIKGLGKKPWGTITSFAFTNDSLLMIIRNNELCTIDSTGSLSKLYKLPNQGMGISKGEKVMYLFDRSKEQKTHALYVLAKGGKYLKLFEIKTPITAVAEMNNTILFSSNNELYQYDLIQKKLTTLTNLPGHQVINSITVNPLKNRVFFSTDSTIYTIQDKKGEIVTNKFSGVLKYFNDGLIVFNPDNYFLIRIVGLDSEFDANSKTTSTNSVTPIPVPAATITPTPSKTPTVAITQTVTPITKPTPTIAVNTTTTQKEIITNASIIKLTKAKLSDDLIIDVIKTSEVNFDLKVESMVNLSNNGVSSAVIKEMKTAMENKNNK